MIALSLNCILKSYGKKKKNFRGMATNIDFSRLKIEETTKPRVKVQKEDLVFGKVFSDHMLEIDWSSENGWSDPLIKPYGDMSISPAASVLHYALECFEGMKAYKDINNENDLRLFRPHCNMERMNNSMKTLYMPSFCGDNFIQCMSELIKIDKDWIPSGEGYSMYLRPTAISTYPYLGVGPSKAIKMFVIMSPVGPYYPEGFKPVKLLAEPNAVRAWPGGVGNTKLGGNYGPTIAPQMEALKKGCSQILWLWGEDHTVTEVGAMNIFFVIKSKDGSKELVTAPLTRGDILPGVTRRSILELAKEWDDLKVTERQITMKEISEASNDGRLLEAFGAGTAAVVAPVSGISYNDTDIVIIADDSSGIGEITERVWDSIIKIQYGMVDHPWSIKI